MLEPFTLVESSRTLMMASAIKLKSNLDYTRGITPKRVTSSGAHLRGSTPGKQSSEETLQRCRVVGDAVSDLTAPELNPRPSAPIVLLTTELTGRSIKKINDFCRVAYFLYSCGFVDVIKTNKNVLFPA